MGAELIIHYPTFSKSIQTLDQMLAKLPDGPDWTIEGDKCSTALLS